MSESAQICICVYYRNSQNTLQPRYVWDEPLPPCQDLLLYLSQKENTKVVTIQNYWGQLGLTLGAVTLGCGWVRQWCWADFKGSFCRWWWFIRSPGPPFVPPALSRSLWLSEGLELFFLCCPLSPPAQEPPRGHTGSGWQIPWTIRWNPLRALRAHRVQPRHTPLSALLTWGDI